MGRRNARTPFRSPRETTPARIRLLMCARYGLRPHAPKPEARSATVRNQSENSTPSAICPRCPTQLSLLTPLFYFLPPMYNPIHDNIPAPKPQSPRTRRRRLRPIRRTYPSRARRRRDKGRADKRRLVAPSRSVPGRRAAPGEVRALPRHERGQARRHSRHRIGTQLHPAHGSHSPIRRGHRQPPRRLAGCPNAWIRSHERSPLGHHPHADNPVWRLGTVRRILRRRPVAVPHERQRSRDARTSSGPRTRSRRFAPAVGRRIRSRALQPPPPRSPRCSDCERRGGAATS